MNLKAVCWVVVLISLLAYVLTLQYISIQRAHSESYRRNCEIQIPV